MSRVQRAAVAAIVIGFAFRLATSSSADDPSALALRVVEAGRPLAGAALTVEVRTCEGEFTRHEVTTDADGLARIVADPGQQIVEARRGEARSTRAVVVVPGSCQLDLSAAPGPLKVQVVDRLREPVEGALVELVERQPGLEHGPITDPGRAIRPATRRTGADGQVTFSPPLAAAYVVLAESPALQHGGRCVVPTLDGPRQLTVTLDEPTGTGELLVNLYEGPGRDRPLRHGVDGCDVDLHLQGDRFARALEPGEGASSVRVGELPTFPCTVTAWATTREGPLGPATAELFPEAGRLTRVDLHLLSATPLKLRLREASGAPFAGRVEVLRPSGGKARVVDAPDGQRDVLNVSGREAYTVVAWSHELAPTRFRGVLVGKGPPGEPVDLRLPEQPRRVIEVRTASGTPVSGARVSVDGHGGYATDARGRLALRGGAPTLRLEVQADGLTGTSRVAAADSTGTISLTLPPASGDRPPADRVVTGRVVDARGAPLCGATVRVIGAPGGPPALDVTAADGSFVVVGCERGPAAVRAYRGDLGLGEALLVDLREARVASDLRIVICAGVPVSGSLGLPGEAGDESVGLRDPEGRDWLGGVTPHPDSFFDLGPVAPGAWDLVVESQDRIELHRQRVEVTPGEGVHVELLLPR